MPTPSGACPTLRASLHTLARLCASSRAYWMFTRTVTVFEGCAGDVMTSTMPEESWPRAMRKVLVDLRGMLNVACADDRAPRDGPVHDFRKPVIV